MGIYARAKAPYKRTDEFKKLRFHESESEVQVHEHNWYIGKASREKAESLLKRYNSEGRFVVRESKNDGTFVLSVNTRNGIEHFHIKKNKHGYYLLKNYYAATLPDLIEFHTHNSVGLECRLKLPDALSMSCDWKIDSSDLVLKEKLGSGAFGVVYRGKWLGGFDVAVKTIIRGSKEEFIEEAKIMTKLRHENLVKLYGVCIKDDSIYIVSEYMCEGSLLNYLHNNKSLHGCPARLLQICYQVCRGMLYLEERQYVHRDLAARNCLVDCDDTVKVADFGLSRRIVDNEYLGSKATIFPLAWTSPEAIEKKKFSSKSDVWSFGVLMWEVFSFGDVPYEGCSKKEIISMVLEGEILEKPNGCPKKIYHIMKKCWAFSPEDRPSFSGIKKRILKFARKNYSEDFSSGDETQSDYSD